jgi:hypothetical protein
MEQLKVETLSMVRDTISFENALAEKLKGKQILSSEGIFLFILVVYLSVRSKCINWPCT